MSARDRARAAGRGTLAQRGPADAQPAGELLLDETLAGIGMAAEDLPAEPIEGIAGQVSKAEEAMREVGGNFAS